MVPASTSDSQPPKTGQRLVLATLLAGYASFYLCRANVNYAIAALLDPKAPYHYTKLQTGTAVSISVAAYAVGKLVLGVVGDVVGGKAIMLSAMFASVVFSFAVGIVEWPTAVGLGTGIVVMGVFWSLNRFAQSGGWGGLVHVVSRWFPAAKNGTIMGILSTSYEVGAIAAGVLSASLMKAGLKWRALFIVNPAVFLAVAIFLAIFLRGSPPKSAPTESKRSASRSERTPLREIFPHLARQPAFWIAVLLSVLLTFVRECFMTWTPTYLTEVATREGSTSPLADGIMKSVFFGIAGMTGALTVGKISDRFGPGKRAPVMVASLILLVCTVLFLGHGGVRGSIGSAAVIALCGLFLLGPYSLLAGAVALDVAGKRGTATAAGIIDAAGYCGATLAGSLIGGVTDRYGWTRAFDVIASAAFVALFVAFLWMLVGRARARAASIALKAS